MTNNRFEKEVVITCVWVPLVTIAERPPPPQKNPEETIKTMSQHQSEARSAEKHKLCRRL